jgi:hypothetical protein
MSAPLTAARSILQSAQGLLNEEAVHPHLAPMLTQAAERLADQAILILQGMRAAAHPATTLGGLDVLGAAAGAAPHEPRIPTIAPPIDAQREQRATPVEGGSDAAGNGQCGEPAPYLTAYTVPVRDAVSPDASLPRTGRGGNGRPPLVWTPARDAVLHEHFGTMKPTPEILFLANTIPAPKPVPSEQSVNDRARVLGLVRPQAYLEALAASRADHARRGNAAWRAQQAEAEPPEPEPAPEAPIAQEEVAPESPPAEAAAADAPTPPKDAAPPPRTITAGQDDTQPVNAPTAPDAAPARELPPPKETRAEKDKRDARSLFDGGWGGREIAADLDLPLGTVSNWVAGWRAERKGKAA